MMMMMMMEVKDPYILSDLLELQVEQWMPVTSSKLCCRWCRKQRWSFAGIFNNFFPLKTVKTTFSLTQDVDVLPEMLAEVEVDHNLSNLIEALEEENDVSRVSANLSDMGITDDEEERVSQGSFWYISYQLILTLLCRGGSQERSWR